MSLAQKRSYSEVITSIVQEPRQIKKIRITKRVDPQSVNVLNKAILDLENCQNSNDALECLIQISDFLALNEADMSEIFKKLNDHYKKETESAVRVKLLTIYGNFSSDPNLDVGYLIDDLILLIKNEKSAKVISQAILVLLKMGKTQTAIPIINKIIQYGQSLLVSSSHIVQKQVILLLGSLTQTPEMGKKILDLVGQYTDSQDARVRAQAFSSILLLGERGVALPSSLFPRATKALQDDYECVRREALQLIYELGNLHPDEIIQNSDSDLELRLVDAAFSKVCATLCDLSMQVRTQAAELLGGMTKVSSEFLHQTLDKKLMSDLRRKKSLHERSMQNFTSGEWSTGKKWADDAPKGEVPAESVSLMASGACGALVHGLEDEFLEVRTASVDSMCRLALINSQFAIASLDFLVDMFNDEIESVRLRSIYSLTAISKHIILREDQLETMLSALEDYAVEIREGLHIMLGACRVSTQNCLTMVVQKVLDVLSKYPEDKLSAYGCLQKVGQKHAELCASLTPHLLHDHPFFDSAEKDVEDPSYVCVLILMFNAAQHMPAMLSLFPETTVKHYGYLRDTMPNLVPHLPLQGQPDIDLKLNETTGSLQFLETLLQNIEAAYSATRARQALLTAAQDNLDRLAAIDPSLTGTANFTATFLGAQLSIELLQAGISNNQQIIPSRECQSRLLKKCLKLQNLFSGFTLDDWLLVKQVCFRASALHIVLIVKDRSQSALAPCQLLLHIASDLSNFLQDNPSMVPDELTVSILNQLASINDPKPGRVYREILPFLQKPLPLLLPKINTNIKMCTVEIIEPSSANLSENVVKVTAGLIASVPLIAQLENLQEFQKKDLRLRLKYPDQNIYFVVPRLKDMKRIITAEGEEDCNWKLRTTVLLSHGIWTEAAQVEVTICLAVKLGPEIELCKPIKIMFSPKPVKRGI